LPKPLQTIVRSPRNQVQQLQLRGLHQFRTGNQILHLNVEHVGETRRKIMGESRAATVYRTWRAWDELVGSRESRWEITPEIVLIVVTDLRD